MVIDTSAIIAIMNNEPERRRFKESIEEVAMKQNLNDPVINEIREVRHRISARFDHDPKQLVSFYLEMQKQYQDRLIETAKNTERRDQPAT